MEDQPYWATIEWQTAVATTVYKYFRSACFHFSRTLSTLPRCPPSTQFPISGAYRTICRRRHPNSITYLICAICPELSTECAWQSPTSTRSELRRFYRLHFLWTHDQLSVVTWYDVIISLLLKMNQIHCPLGEKLSRLFFSSRFLSEMIPLRVMASSYRARYCF